MRAMILAGGLAAALLAASPAHAEAPDADRIAFAAREHDLGYAAYSAGRFDEAATHFENAYFAAPNAKEVRAAIRARVDASEWARAATLSAIALRRWPDDAPTKQAAADAIAQAAPHVHEVKIGCSSPCDVVVDGKLIPDEKVSTLLFYVDPGHHDLAVGFGNDRSVSKAVEAVAGGSSSFDVDAPPLPPAPVPPPSKTPPAGTASVASPPPPSTYDQAPPSTRPFGPAVFVTMVVLTVGAGGALVWSGLDAENNPGTAAVRADCVGKGTACPQYQDGLDAQRRTNILIGVTSGLGALTAVVGLFMTQWRSPHVASSSATIQPAVGPGQLGVYGTF